MFIHESAGPRRFGQDFAPLRKGEEKAGWMCTLLFFESVYQKSYTSK